MESESKPQCQYQSDLDPLYVCKEPAQSGKDFCIFHDPDPEKDKGKFRQRLQEQIEKQGRNPRYKFIGYQFPSEYVSWCDFLMNNSFEESVDFREAKFHTFANFTRANFKDKVYFDEARFNDRTCFTGTHFEAETSFRGAEFCAKTVFHTAIFDEVAKFTGAIFYDAVYFSWAQFKKEADFFGSIFHSEAHFEGYEGIELFGSVADLQEMQFIKPEKVVFNHVNLSKCKLSGTDIRRVDFVGVHWARKKLPLLGSRTAIYDEITYYSEDEDGIMPEIEKLYRQLTHKYEQARDYQLAGHFHYGAMEMTRQRKQSEWKRNIFSLTAWYHHLAGYGERPGWTLTMLGFIWLFLSIGFFFAYPHGQSLNRLGWSLLNSAKALLFRGAPENANFWAQVLGFTGSIFGPMQIAFFLIAIRRRFKR